MVRSLIRSVLLCCAAMLAVATLVADGWAVEAAADRRTISITVSTGVTVRLPQPAATLFVAEPAIADVQTPSSSVVFVFGKKAGRTTLFGLDEAGKSIIEYRVVVTQPIEDLRNLLRSELGGGNVSATYTPNGLVLSGVVAAPEMVEAAKSIASQFLGEGGVVVNRLKVSGKAQVNLRVRVAEVGRNVTKELGLNWSAIGDIGSFSIGLATGRDVVGASGNVLRAAAGGSLFGSFNNRNANIVAVIDALASDGLVRILAEPNLTAVSGEPASFLAGGEFPIPVSQGEDRVTVEYRRFGVSLEFVPTVLNENLISIRVRPEVSELSSQGAVTLNSISVPALSTRRAETTVELGSGQSFAIAGLIRNNFSTAVDSIPGLGDLPVLGALFRSSRFQRNETELVIIVTPYIVVPTASARVPQTAAELIGPPSDLERILYNKLARSRDGRPPAAQVSKPIRLKGDNGFILD